MSRHQVLAPGLGLYCEILLTWEGLAPRSVRLANDAADIRSSGVRASIVDAIGLRCAREHGQQHQCRKHRYDFHGFTVLLKL